jgi:hypothetical protein
VLLILPTNNVAQREHNVGQVLLRFPVQAPLGRVSRLLEGPADHHLFRIPAPKRLALEIPQLLYDLKPLGPHLQIQLLREEAAQVQLLLAHFDLFAICATPDEITLDVAHLRRVVVG